MSTDEFGHRTNIFGYIPTIIVIIIGIGLFTIIVVPILSNPEQFIENIKEVAKEKSDNTRWIYDTSDMVKVSEDCPELKKAQLDLISKGANDDSWFPTVKDKSLKMAQDRYDILC